MEIHFLRRTQPLPLLLLVLVLLFSSEPSSCSDITPIVFNNILDAMPAAFGDFNSDELTDVFMLRDGQKRVEIFLAAEQEPLLRSSGQNHSCKFQKPISSVVPGDFDGDAFMDVLVTTENPTYVYILWGENGKLNCSEEAKPVIEMQGQPLALDYNGDMIVDLFGVDAEGRRTFWVFDSDRNSKPRTIYMDSNHEFAPIKKPHSNAYLDLDGDALAELVVSTEKNFEIWRGVEGGGFAEHPRIVNLPKEALHWRAIVGQATYLDVELTGKTNMLLPVCFDKYCSNSSILMYSGDSDSWRNLQVNFMDDDKTSWSFVLDEGRMYLDTITLRGGDFNMDGYPDLLATLKSSTSGKTKSFLLENVSCKNCQKSHNRTFEVRWNALGQSSASGAAQTVMAVFYDFYQDGILDAILMEFDGSQYRCAAFKNSLDYDANFVKVMVLTGRTNSRYPLSPGSFGKKKRTYGTNLPGPSISYSTTTQDGSPRCGIAAQLPQSAHFSLILPFSMFGLGRTPNFVDSLTIGVSGKSREWPQIIPNSQMVVIPNPIGEPSRWKAQLFVTPSKLILLSAAALTATCGLITAIIVGLYWKERREDKIEKLQEAHRFHFDAM